MFFDIDHFQVKQETIPLLTEDRGYTFILYKDVLYTATSKYNNKKTACLIGIYDSFNYKDKHTPAVNKVVYLNFFVDDEESIKCFLEDRN